MESSGMGWSEWIALGAALASSVISVISWRWAKASADAAKQANVLQLHSYRESLYVAFHELNGRFQVYQEHISFDQVLEFFRHSRTCFLYLSPNLADQIATFYDKVWKVTEKQSARLMALEDVDKHKDDPYLKAQCDASASRANELYRELRLLVDEAIPIGRSAVESLKDEIRIKLPEPLPKKPKKAA